MQLHAPWGPRSIYARCTAGVTRCTGSGRCCPSARRRFLWLSGLRLRLFGSPLASENQRPAGGIAAWGVRFLLPVCSAHTLSKCAAESTPPALWATSPSKGRLFLCTGRACSEKVRCTKNGPPERNRSRPLPVAGGGRRRFWFFRGDCRAAGRWQSPENQRPAGGIAAWGVRSPQSICMMYKPAPQRGTGADRCQWQGEGGEGSGFSEATAEPQGDGRALKTRGQLAA